MQFEFMPDFVLDQMKRLPKNLAEASVREIEASREFDPHIRKIRMAFWAEYELSASRMKRMSLSAVAHRMGMTVRHIEVALRDLWQLAFILCPPESYDNFLDEATNFGYKRLRDEILTIPIHSIDPLTNEKIVNMKAAELLLKTVAFLDVRRHGMPKQRIEQITMQGKPADFQGPQKSIKTLEDVEKRIAELEASGITIDAAKKILEQGGKLPTEKDSETTAPTNEELTKTIDPELIVTKDELKAKSLMKLVSKVSDIELD